MAFDPPLPPQIALFERVPSLGSASQTSRSFSPADEDQTVWHQASARGAAAEFRAIARLLELGHKVAVPVVDDDGVDLVVDYRLRVQVKSASHRVKGSGYGRPFYEFTIAGERNRAPVVDLFALFGMDTEEWWIVPAVEWSGARKLRVYPGSAMNQWHEAWWLFGGCEPTPVAAFVGSRTAQDAREASGAGSDMSALRNG